MLEMEQTLLKYMVEAGGGGAGAGIGGKGGKGGDGSKTQIPNTLGHADDNPILNTNNGFDGENGEDCGIVNIYNKMIIYAYGGAGGSGGNAINSSGGGGGGYPAAGIGGGGAGGGGGNHSEGAGGYSGGGAECNFQCGYNGSGGGIITGCLGSGGGGYFTSGIGDSNAIKGTGSIGGQTGCPWNGGDRDCWYANRAGSGGNSGAGGSIKVSSESAIYAYNGNMITNNDYETQYYEYNKVGTLTNNLLNVITKKNGEKFIPCKIFSQTGIIRETYTTNQGQFSLNKVKTGISLPSVANSYDSVVRIKATNEITTEVTGYNNGYMLNQGIGSGAGYLESANGTYTVDPSMN